MSTNLVAFFSLYFSRSDFWRSYRPRCLQETAHEYWSIKPLPGLIGRSSRLLKHTRATPFRTIFGELLLIVDGHLRCRFAHHPWSVHNVPELRSLRGQTININREAL